MMSDFREFTGYAPTHCTICGSKWESGCKPTCVNATTASRDGDGWAEYEACWAEFIEERNARMRSQSNESALRDLQRELLEALRPFADKLADVGQDEADDDLFREMSPANRRAPAMTVGHLRRALAAIAKAEGK